MRSSIVGAASATCVLVALGCSQDPSFNGAAGAGAAGAASSGVGGAASTSNAASSGVGGAASTSSGGATGGGGSGAGETFGDLEITDALVLSTNTLVQGDTISAEATVHNPSGSPIAVNDLVISYFEPGGTKQAGPWGQIVMTGPVELPAGGDEIVSGSRTFTNADPLGTYNAYVTYQDTNGTWHDSATNRSFTVTAPAFKYLRGVVDQDILTMGALGEPYCPPVRSVAEYQFLAARGHKIVRLPTQWGPPEWGDPPACLQPTLGGPLDAFFMARLHQEIDNIHAAGMTTILELQGGCRYPGDHSAAMCGNGITQAQVNDVWVKLSNEFKNDPGVSAYDVMNEPYDIDAAVWQPYSQGIVDAIRANGDNKLIWMEGIHWSNASNWGTNNGPPWINDPANNILYSAHSYPPTSSGGAWTDTAYYDSDQGWIDALDQFTSWCKTYNVRCGIGEVNWPSSVISADWQKWNALGEIWYQHADAANLTVTFFDVATTFDDPPRAYVHGAGNGFTTTPPSTVNMATLDTGLSQTSVIEAHPSQ